jgi:hypothetical protein
VLLEEWEKNKIKMGALVNERNCYSKSVDEIAVEIKKFEEILVLQLKQIEVTKEEIEKLKEKKNDFDSILRNTQTELKTVETVLENTIIINIITVASGNDDCNENDYDLLNGLVDLNRDIIIKLLKLMKDEAKARNVCFCTFSFLYFT